MRRVLPLISAVALLGAFAATPATAGDLLYPGGSMLSEGAIGKPIWLIQAQCAGFFGATSNIMTERGDADGAAEAKAQAVAFGKDSVERLMKDRGLSRGAATDTVAQAIDSGRAEGFEKIKYGGGLGARSHWNVARSVCLDVADVYDGIRYR